MSPLPPKKEVALALLERSSVHVYLDPRSKEVIVPPWLATQPRLVLQIGLNMPVPIPDLRLDDDAMTCTLSFNHSPFLCVVPWKSVFAMVGDDSRGMVWPDDVPPELSNEGASRPLEAVRSPAVRSVPKKEARPPLAEAPKVAATPAKPKRTRKKGGVKDEAAKEEAKVEAPARTAPVAVPARAPSPRAAPQPAAAAAPPAAPSAAASSPVASPAASSAASSAASPPAARRPGSGAGKPKRELPPYLRVVK